MIRQILNGAWTCCPVVVKAVKGGGVGVAGTVDVQPLVNQVDGTMAATAHGTIYGLPYSRIQGGGSALIIDPIVGDLGLMWACQSDISTVIATKAVANPGSRRKFDPADGIYIPAILNGAPVQFVRVTGGAVFLVAPFSSASGTFSVNVGASGTFTTPTGQTVTVRDGIVTNIY